MLFFRRLRDLIGLPSEIDVFLKYLGFPFGLAGLTVYFAWAKENPHWVIFLGAAVYAFAAVGIWTTLHLWKAMRIYRQLHLVAITPAHVNAELGGTANVIVGITFKNTSERDIYYRIKSGSLSISGRNNQEARVAEGVKFIPSKVSGSFSTSNVSGIPAGNNIMGFTSLTLLYGPAEDDLPYEVTFSASLTLTVTLNADGSPDNLGSFAFRASFNPVEHRKVIV